MASSIPELPQVTSIPSGALFLLSYAGSPSEIITFNDLCKNFQFLQSPTSNDLLLGVASSPNGILRITDTNKFVGIANSSSFSPISLLHISGVSGSNVNLTIQNPSGYLGAIRFYDSTGSWYVSKDYLNNFAINGNNGTTIVNNSLYINNSGDLLLTDGSQYSKTVVDSGVNLQLSAEKIIKFSVDDNTNSNDLIFNHSGLNTSSDLYLGYSLPENAVSGSFFGISGSVFVDKDDGTVRISNLERVSDGRLMVSNLPVAGVPYKTLVLEDSSVPNLFFRTTGSTDTISLLYNQPQSQLHFGLNKASASAVSTDKLIADLSNGRLGVGGIDPDYTLDVSGNQTLISRYQTNQSNAFTRIQSNTTTTTSYVASAYGSGDYNSFIIGYDFDKETTGPSGPSGPSGPNTRNGQFFFQTGDSTNTYSSSRNIVTISDQGDINTKGIYTSDNNFCYGKFLQIHRASNPTGNIIYLNLDNIDYTQNQSGSVAYHSLFPASGRVIGVDFICQTNTGISNSTGYLVFTSYTGLTNTGVGGNYYISGLTTNLPGGYLQVWNTNTNTYVNPSLNNHAFVSGALTGQSLFNLKGKINNTVVGSKFYGNTSNLSFGRYDLGSWVAYGVNSTGGFFPLTGAMNLTTTVEYFYASDTDSASGTYIL